jgi:hypothetical protein
MAQIRICKPRIAALASPGLLSRVASFAFALTGVAD